MYNSTDIIEKMLVNIITDEFLESVDKWSKYNGDKFSIGDSDIHIENKGIFKKTTIMPKIEGIFEENEEVYEYYDVTQICNSSRCSDYNKIIIISEKYPDFFTENDKLNRPSKLFIYAIFDNNSNIKPDDSKYTEYPSFERLKNDFESSNYTNYTSLIYNFCGRYSLSIYNSKCDRILSFTAITNDLICLDLDDFSKNIKIDDVVRRFGNMTDNDRKSYIK